MFSVEHIIYSHTELWLDSKFIQQIEHDCLSPDCGHLKLILSRLYRSRCCQASTVWVRMCEQGVSSCRLHVLNNTVLFFLHITIVYCLSGDGAISLEQSPVGQARVTSETSTKAVNRMSLILDWKWKQRLTLNVLPKLSFANCKIYIFPLNSKRRFFSMWPLKRLTQLCNILY